MRTARLLLLSLLAAPIAIAPAPSRAEDLRIGLALLSNSVDPHFYNLASNLTLSMHIFDRLIQRAPDASLTPGLALAWRPVGDTAWEFDLRPDVKWHDGAAFTADDVAFTVARAPTVPNSPSSFAGHLRAVARVEVLGPLKLRLHTRAPAPNLPGDLASVAIVSRHAGEGASTDDYNTGRAAIGTGAYRFVSFARGDRVEMRRNDNWWGSAPAWDRLTLRNIGNGGARVAALLAADVDVIDAPPIANLPQLRADPRVAVMATQGLRIIFLGPDFTREGPNPFITDNAGQMLPRNPLRDLKVRQALSLSINRAGLAQRVMENTATPTGQWMPAGTPGYAADIAVPDANPQEARRLLTEAGFPDGFRMVLHGPNDRYPNDAAVTQAIAQMFTRIGVQTSVDISPGAVHGPRGVRHEYAMGLWGWSNNTGEAGYVLVNVLGSEIPAAGRGVSNTAGYANAALDALTDEAVSTLDDTKRAALLAGAVRMAVADTANIPLFHLVNSWAVRRGLTYDARADEQTIAMSVRK